MKLKAFLFLFALLCVGCSEVNAQRKKVINYTEIGALIQSSTSQTGSSKLSGFRTRTGVTKLVSENFGFGFALGTDNYKNSSGRTYNTLPLTLNASYFFDPELSGLKADFYGGYALKLFNNLNKGLTAGLGLSYSFPVNEGLNLGIQTGYNYQKIDYPNNFVLDNSFDIGSIRLGLGITFK